MKLRGKNESNALYIIFEGIAYLVVLNLFNPFVQIFAKRIGAGDIHIALINALPPLVAIFILIPFGIIIEKINKKRQTVRLLIFINSLFYAIIAFVPFIPDKIKVVAYVLMIGLMNWPGSLYTATWQSFFSDTFRGAEANRIYSVRSKYGSLSGMLTALLTGMLLTVIPKTDDQRLMVYQAFYALCFVISLVQLYFLTKVRPSDADTPAGSSGRPFKFGKAEMKEIIRNKPFIYFCLITFFFHISWQMGWPLFFIYNADYANLNEFQFGIVSVAMSLAAFLTYSLWNRFIEKKGTRFVIMFGAIGLAVNPFFYTGMMGVGMIVITSILSGLAGAGFNLTLFCGLLEVLPEDRKTVYISFFNTFINISGFASPLLGVLLYRHTSIFAAFLVIGILRVAASAMFFARWRLGRNAAGAYIKENGLSGGCGV